MQVKVSKRHQIALPSAARQALGIAAGDRLLVDVQDNLLILLPTPESFATRLSGLHSEVWAEVDSAEYLEQERAEWRDCAPTAPA